MGLRTPHPRLSRRSFSAGVAATAAVAAAPRIAAAQDKTEIRMACYTVNETWDAMTQKMVDEFNAQSQLANVTMEWRPGDQYWDKLQTEFAGGQAPDITVCNIDWLVPGASRGMFLDLNPYYERDQVDQSDLWYPVARDWSYDGGLYGSLLYATGQALYVNKGILEAAGEPLPAAGWTWDDLLASCQAVTNPDEDIYGIMFSVIDPPYWGTSFIHGAGGTVLNETRDECTLNSAEARAALQWVADLALVHEVMPVAGSYEGQQNPFLSGKIAYYFGGTWDESAIRSSGIDWDFLPMPAHPETGIRSVQNNSNAWSMLSTVSDEEAAWEVIKYIGGPEGARATMAAGIPGYTSVIESQEFLDLHAPQDITVPLKDFQEVGHDYYPTEDSAEWWTAVTNEFGPMWTGEDTVENCTQRATDAVNEIFSRRGSF